MVIPSSGISSAVEDGVVEDFVKVFTPSEMILVWVCSASALVSRASSEFIRRLFEQEVPEIFDGIVEIKGIIRQKASAKTKLYGMMSIFSIFSDVLFVVFIFIT